MLNYELCKKLKEAGFPESHKVGDENYPIAPTLEELIEAFLDKNLHNLLSLDYDPTRHRANEWQVRTKNLKSEEVIGEGSTPEIAVAMLYLKLNEKITT